MSTGFFYEAGPRSDRLDRLRRAGGRAFLTSFPCVIGMSGGFLMGEAVGAGDWIAAAIGAALVVIGLAALYATRLHRGRLVR